MRSLSRVKVSDLAVLGMFLVVGTVSFFTILKVLWLFVLSTPLGY